MNCSPGLKIVPSGMVSLIKLAWAHADVAGLKVRVGAMVGADGVPVGENCKGVWV